MRRLIAPCLLALAASGVLSGCAGVRASTSAPSTINLPVLQLPPAALSEPLALQQQLQFRFGKHERHMQALLESDAQAVRLLVQAMGQSGVRLQWDGVTLEQQRAPWLPRHVRGERVLDDLQFAFWPVETIAAVLPAGWEVQAAAGTRHLVLDGTTWLEARQLPDGSLLLINHAEGYELSIQSVPVDGDATW